MKESLKRMGTFCAAYGGTQYVLAWKRGVEVEDPFNSMGAASVTVGAYNFMKPGSFRCRARNAARQSLLAGAAGYAIGVFHLELYRVLTTDRESNSAAHPHSDQNGVSAAMKSLEENFNK